MTYMPIMDCMLTDLMTLLGIVKCTGIEQVEPENWLKVRQHAPECNLIHYLSEH